MKSLTNNGKTKKQKKEALERMLNEIETSQLSDIEIKRMVMRTFKELTDNCRELSEN